MEATYLSWAVGLGALSAVSLPIGSAVGLWLRPRAGVAALFAAFGAGALVAALSVELVAPTVLALHEPHGENGDPRAAFLALVAGAVFGGLVFVALDRALATRGGFLRKTATLVTHLHHSRRTRAEALLADLCSVPLLRALPPERVHLLVRDVVPISFAAGEILVREGEPGRELYFLRSGNVEVSTGGETLRQLGPGAVLGELALLTEQPRSATATACNEVEALVLSREDLARWREECPEFDEALRHSAADRLTEISERARERSEEERRWASEAARSLVHGAAVPTRSELSQMAEEHPGAPLAVWLGLLIDGIPESIVIGSGLMTLIAAQLAVSPDVAFGAVVPYTLIAGLFLSNFPEAMSSSVGMRTQGWGVPRVLGLWTALMVITAFGAGVGYALGETLPPTLLVGTEGMAAGAMLTAITATMIPEAVTLAHSGAAVGLCTLAGFLSAVSFALIG